MKQTFQNFIKEQKGEKTQSQFAKEIGISRTYINDLIQGKRNLSIKTLEKIANKMGYSVEIKFIKKDSANGN